VVLLTPLQAASAAIAASVCGFILGFPYVAARKLVKPPRRVGSWTPSDLGLEYEDVTIRANDGVELSGWFIDVGAKATVIAIHGYTSSRWDETYMKPVIMMLARNGFNVAAFDFRAHGRSGGNVTTFGFKEVDDYRIVISWLKAAKTGGAERIGVIGFSMGGAVALMLAAEDNRVDAIVADSPYMDIVASGRRWIMRMGEPVKSILLGLYPLVIFYSSRLLGIDASKLKLYNYAEKIRKPVLLVAGRRDDLVSVEEIEDFYNAARKANGNVELWVTDSQHVRSIVDYPDEYEKRVIGFFKRWLT
jgi:dipeptidyl aminopeptidase/acylaminoacyl peptidase